MLPSPLYDWILPVLPRPCASVCHSHWVLFSPLFFSHPSPLALTLISAPSPAMIPEPREDGGQKLVFAKKKK